MKPTRSQINAAILSQAPAGANLPDWVYKTQAPRTKPNAHPEADIQRSIVAFLHRLYPNIIVSASLVGAQLKGGMLAMMRAKAMGVLTGDPDLTLRCPGGKTILLEVKSDKGSVTPAQKEL